MVNTMSTQLFEVGYIMNSGDITKVLDFVTKHLDKDITRENNCQFKTSEELAAVELLTCLLDPLPELEIFQFDKIMYAHHNPISIYKLYEHTSFEQKDALVHKYLRIFCNLYLKDEPASDAYIVSICDMALLQLLWQAKRVNLTNIFHKNELMDICAISLCSHKVRQIAVGLSTLYICFKKQRITFKTMLYEPRFALQLIKLQKYPEAQDQVLHEATRWISRQAIASSKMFINDIQLNKCYPFMAEMAEVSELLCENRHSNALLKLHDAISTNSFKPVELLSTDFLNIMLSYFLKPISESDRVSRAKLFLEIFAATNIIVFEKLVQILNRTFEYLIRHSQNWSEQMEMITSCHSYNLFDVSFHTSYIALLKSIDNVRKTTDYEFDCDKDSALYFIYYDDCAGGARDDTSEFANFCFYDNLLKVTHLLTILYSLNNQWGELLKIKSFKPLIGNNLFESEWITNECKKLTSNIHVGCQIWWISTLLLKCPFLLPLKCKKYLITLQFSQVVKKKAFKLVVTRESLLNDINNFLKNDSRSPSDGKFEFKNEMGRGTGVTKECYSIFSREIKRRVSNLWLGESSGTNGKVIPHNTLYPSPLSASEETSHIYDYFFMIGCMLAKSIQDHQILDIPFSNALLKWLTNSNCGIKIEIIDMVDLKETCPNLAGFITSLENVVNKKEEIKSNLKLNAEQINEAVNNLTFDGCRFEDLYLNFTLPGYPNIELKEGGKDISVSPLNVEEYLELVAFWFLRKGPRAKLNAFKNGFERIMKPDLLGYIYPDELKSIICGQNFHSWTQYELATTCRFRDGYSRDSVAIGFLFDILSKFNAEEQEEFLQFTTSSSKLPSGGLQSLNPPLTISCFKCDHPDQYLPSASTCINTLRLPKYSSRDVTREKLLYAMKAMKEGSLSFQLV